MDVARQRGKPVDRKSLLSLFPVPFILLPKTSFLLLNHNAREFEMKEEYILLVHPNGFKPEQIGAKASIIDQNCPRKIIQM